LRSELKLPLISTPVLAAPLTPTVPLLVATP